MPGKKGGNKASEEKEAAVLEQQQREAEAEATAAKQRQVESIFTAQPSLIVPRHDAASIESALHRLFFSLYHPAPVTPAPAPILPSPPVEEQKEAIVASKGKPAAKGRPAAKSTVVAPPPPPIEPVAPPPPPPRPADHPLSLLEQRWREHELRYEALEAEVLKASALRRERVAEHDAEMRTNFSLIPDIDLPLPASFTPPLPSVDLQVESLLDLQSLVAVAVEREAARRAPILRAMPKIIKRPSTRVSQVDDDVVDEVEEKRKAVRAGRQRSKGRVLKLTDRQRVAREVSAVAMSPILLADSQRHLQRMQQKRHFLLNPRHREAEQSPIALQADVDEVRWERWDEGGLYEQSVRVTNTGTTALRVTLVHPTPSSPFSITASFPPSATSSNTLAPGMSCTLTVCFRPTSLASLTDVVKVKSPTAATLSIPLLALRVPTALTLPSVVELPPALVSRTSVVRLTADNTGLPSSFRILTEAEFEREQGVAAEASAAVLSSTVEAGPFSVYPREFDLDEGGGIQMTVTFAPQPSQMASASERRPGEGSVSVFREQLYIVSDDGTVSRHELRGEATPLVVRLLLPSQVDSQLLTKRRAPFLFSIEQRRRKAPPHSSASSASHLSFPVTTLGSCHTLCMQLTNPSPVALPYQWLLAFNDAYSSLTPIFHLYPPSGTLMPYETREIVATFTPRGGEAYHHSAQLLINGEERLPGRQAAEDVSVAEVQLTGEGRFGRLTMELDSADSEQATGWALQRGEWGERRVRVQNTFEVQLEYTVEAVVVKPVQGDNPTVRVQLWPAQGRVGAGGAAELSVNVQAEEVGEVELTLEMCTWPGGQRSQFTLSAVVSPTSSASPKAVADGSAEVASSMASLSVQGVNEPQ